MNTTADDLVQVFLDVLAQSPALPGLLGGSDHLLDHDLLPVEEEELPVAGVYLADDRQVEEDNSAGAHLRTAVIRVEIRAVGHMLRATLALRRWVVATILSNPTLIQLTKSINHSFTPFGMPSNQKLAGADLDFEVSYYWSPE